MKKIVFLSQSLYNYFDTGKKKEFGGVSRIFRLVTKLSEYNDYFVSCYVGDFGQPAVERKQGVLLIKSKIGQKRYAHTIFKNLVKEKPDLIVEFYASAQVFLLGLLKKIYGQKFVFFVGSDKDVNGSYAQNTNYLFYKLYTWGLKSADRVICQTRDQARMLKKVYGIKGVTILSPYIAITTPLNYPRKYILWVGRSAFYKRPELFIKLARLMPEEKFFMICNPSIHDKGIHKHILATGQVLPNITIKESVPFDEIQKYYAQAKFLINTSDLEGFPNTFIEAAIEKTPVVSLNVDPNEMLTRHACGIYCRQQFSKLVNKSKELVKNEKMRNSLGLKAAIYAAENHDLSKAIPEIKNVFDEILV